MHKHVQTFVELGPPSSTRTISSRHMREREAGAARSRSTCYRPPAGGLSASKSLLSEISSEHVLLLIPGIDCSVCGESNITILEWDRPLRSGRLNPFRKIEWGESPIVRSC